MQAQVAVSDEGGSVLPYGSTSNEWDVLWGLFTSHDPHQLESLCAQLLQLPEVSVVRYLLQYVYMAVSRPSGPLERAITQLCSRSFNMAVQVSWLLLALLQDQPGNRHIRLFKDACERAALTGTWMSPFEQAAIQLTQQQQQQQPEQLASTQQVQRQQQQQGGDSLLSPTHLTVHSRSSPAAPGASAAAAVGGPSTPTSPAGSGSPTALAAVSSRSSLDLGHRASVDLAHRFRNSLDLELMRHTSSQDLAPATSAPTGSMTSIAERPGAAAAAAAAAGNGFSAKKSPEHQRQHQKQPGQHGLPKLKTRLAGSTSQSATASPAAASSTGNAGAGASQLYSSSSSSNGSRRVAWGAVSGSVAAQYSCFEEYLSARRTDLQAVLGAGEGVSELIEASHEVALGNGPEGIGCLVTHEEELSDYLSMSVLLSQPPRSPSHAAARDSYLATLDFVEALCETSSSLTRFPPAERKRVLHQCLARISQEVEAATVQGVAVRYPIDGCGSKVLRLLVEDAAILNSRDKAPFLLLLETQAEALPTQQSATATASAQTQAGLVSSSVQQVMKEPSAAAIASGAGVNVKDSSQDESREHKQQQGSPRRPKSPQKLSPLRRSSHAGDLDGAASSGRAVIQLPSSPMPHQQQQQQQHSEPEPLLQRSCPSLLELQMQETAAMLRGEPTAKLVRVQIQVLPSGMQLGSSQGARSDSPVASGPFSPTTQARALMSSSQRWQQQQRIIQQQQQLLQLIQQQEDSDSSDEDAIEPWVFGEVPASALAAVAAAADSRLQQGAAAAAAAAGSSMGPVRVVIEVVGPTGPQLALPQASQQRGKQRRRLPSMEAIDIIAGKLGRSALPDPADIGPPLHPDSISTCSSRRTSSEFDAVEAAVPSGSSSGGSSTHMPAVIEGDPAPGSHTPSAANEEPVVANGNASSGRAAAAEAGGWQHVRAPSARAVRRVGPLAGSSADGGSSGNSSNAVRGRRSSWASGQQQQPSTPSRVWGRLFGGRQQQQQQPQLPPSPQRLGGAPVLSREHLQQMQADAAAAAAEQSKRAAAVFGERWSKACARNAAASPYGELPGWGLQGVIIKSGDDCRQELLALQLIRELQDVWTAAGLPLWVRPFDVLVTSANTALIELIPDAFSVHTIKARARRTSTSSTGDGVGRHGSSSATAAAAAAAGLSPVRSMSMQQKPWGTQQQQQQWMPHRVRHSYSGPGSSNGSAAAAARQPLSPSMSTTNASGSSSPQANLADFFFARWQRGTPECLAAQRRFVESLAGYSLATYLLQVKDRHNGNIMMDASGRIIHIDFGFMLSNTPGGGWVKFEAAPMKLTRELLEVMDSDSEGTPSELFDYFKVLCIQGFLAVRKERHRLVGLVRIMADCCKLQCPGTPPAWQPTATAEQRAKQQQQHGTPAARRSSSGGGSSNSARRPLPRSISGSVAGIVDGAATTGGFSVAPWPCFKVGGDRVVSAFEERFEPQMSEAACVQHVLWLISTSLDAWTTRTYDYYQLVLNGIL